MHESTSTITPAEFWRNASAREPWPIIVAKALELLGGKNVPLADLYQVIEEHPRAKERKHFKAKIRQKLHACEAFEQDASGLWSFAEKYRPDKVKHDWDALRKRWPRIKKPVN